MFPVWSDWNIIYTAKGLWKRRLGGLIKLAALTALIVAAANAAIKPELWSLQRCVSLAQSGFRNILQRGIGALTAIQARLN
jgi:hypothetical protein